MATVSFLSVSKAMVQAQQMVKVFAMQLLTGDFKKQQWRHHQYL